MKPLKILVLDNYDSFTYNLVQYLEEIEDVVIEVHRNDQIELAEVNQYDGVILSPGPGLPKDAGIMPKLIEKYSASKPIFGVCLGLQAIGEAFGSTLLNLDQVYHGMATEVKVTSKNCETFKNIDTTFQAGRYHSWVVNNKTIPESMEVTAVAENEVIMAMQHKTFPVSGVQFHPESIMTPDGRTMLQNFINQCKNFRDEKNS